jgi:hypothetical protein
MKSIKLLMALAFASLFSLAQAKSLESIAPTVKVAPQKEQKDPDVAVHLITSDKQFLDLGIAPEKLGPYILQMVQAYKDEFQNEKSVVAISLEITALPAAEGKDCSDYTKCVLVKYFIQGDDMTDKKKVEALGERLMKIKEIEITNFQSTSKASFILYIKN